MSRLRYARSASYTPQVAVIRLNRLPSVSGIITASESSLVLQIEACKHKISLQRSAVCDDGHAHFTVRSSMKGFGCWLIVAVGLLLSDCWANPSLVKIQSDPPGVRVSYDGHALGVTPISTVLACPLKTQYMQFELAEKLTRDVPLLKRPIRYFVPWYAIVAAGVFTFSTTWLSEACVPDDFTVDMENGRVQEHSP